MLIKQPVADDYTSIKKQIILNNFSNAIEQVVIHYSSLTYSKTYIFII